MFHLPSAAARRADPRLQDAVVVLAGLTRPERFALPSLPQAKAEAAAAFAIDKAARSMDVLTVSPMAEVRLTRIGPRGGHRHVHNFGPLA